MTEFRLRQKGNGLTLREKIWTELRGNIAHGLCPSRFGWKIQIKDLGKGFVQIYKYSPIITQKMSIITHIISKKNNTFAASKKTIL